MKTLTLTAIAALAIVAPFGAIAAPGPEVGTDTAAALAEHPSLARYLDRKDVGDRYVAALFVDGERITWAFLLDLFASSEMRAPDEDNEFDRIRERREERREEREKRREEREEDDEA